LFKAIILEIKQKKMNQVDSKLDYGESSSRISVVIQTQLGITKINIIS